MSTLDRNGTASATACVPRLALSRIPMILMYHGVADVAEDPNQLSVAPGRFAEQMGWLKRHGLHGVAVGTLVKAMRAGRARGLVGLTFDDGYASVLEAAVPELLRHGFTASMFILSGRLGGSNKWDEGPAWPLVSADQVRELAAAGMEVGSHGATHQRLAGIGSDELKAEVSESRAAIAELVGVPVGGFAYPYGSVDAEARRAVRGAGYDYACAVATPMAELSVMALPRMYIGQRDDARRMALKRLLYKGHVAVNGRRA